MKRPELKFIYDQLVTHTQFRNGMSVEARVIIRYEDENGVGYECNKVIKCRLRKAKEDRP